MCAHLYIKASIVELIQESMLLLRKVLDEGFSFFSVGINIFNSCLHAIS